MKVWELRVALMGEGASEVLIETERGLKPLEDVVVETESVSEEDRTVILRIKNV